jgi:hypothetical protein
MYEFRKPAPGGAFTGGGAAADGARRGERPRPSSIIQRKKPQISPFFQGKKKNKKN